MTGLNKSLVEVLEYSAANSDPSTTEVREDPADNPLDIESLDEDEDSDIDLLLDGVKDPIDRLYKLSIWIRNPSSRFASSKALRYQQIDPEPSADLLQVVDEFDYDYQFAYWKKHRENLSQRTKTVTQHIEVHNGMAPIQPNVEIQANGVPKPLMDPVQSVTAASSLNIPQLSIRDDQSNASVSELFSRAETATKRKVFRVSLLLHIVLDGTPDRKSMEVKAPRYWYGYEADNTNGNYRAHLIHDLRPYICTYERCKNPDQLYDTRQGWIQHENASHRRVLRCPEHPDQTFPKLEGYQEHLRNGHANYGNEISAIFISHASVSTLTSPGRCSPICPLSLSTARALESHIALHLERFSLFSLPRSVGEDDNDANEADSNKANVALDGSRDEAFDEDMEFPDELEEAEKLRWAAERGYKAISKLLLDTGKANPDAKDKDAPKNSTNPDEIVFAPARMTFDSARGNKSRK
ncbi:hypothetical protein EDB81DRAFT_897215 [Dactylonectria macrodidyma]|uniref:C2H2-type domain-containing protein n=1 Tax=Dactylonectria macrodidyma TaxID=307937 RepID=A0A9P9FUB7_9HYPO|nr:hypothetical protein EDB81DRAFT_897215 [Dactylonectria macrodidyma]